MRLALALALVGCAHAPPSDAPLVLHVFAFNDLHGHLEPPEEPWITKDGPVRAGGVAHLAAHAAALRAKERHVAVVAAGDLIGASPLASAILHDEPTILALNALGLDFNAIGNHELDEGTDELVRLMRGGCHPERGCEGETWTGARFVTSSANVLRDGSVETLFPASWIKEVEGVRVGFIGLTTRSTPDHQPAHFRGARFLHEVEAGNAEARRLASEGVRAIVVVIHEGLVTRGDMNTCEDPRGELDEIVRALDRSIDVVISGHTHRAYVCDLDGRTITSAGSYGRAYTTLALELDRAGGEIRSVRAQNTVTDHAIPPRPEVAAIVARSVAFAEKVGDRVVGRITADIPRKIDDGGSSPLGRLIADAQLEATRAAGARLALMHGRGIRAQLAYARSGRETEDGVVSFAEVAAIHPFNNHLMTVTVTGRELLAFLDEQLGGEAEPRLLSPSEGLRYSYANRKVDPASLLLDGAPIALDADVRLTINDFLAGRGALARARDTVKGVTDAEALARYLSARSPITPSAAARVLSAP